MNVLMISPGYPAEMAFFTRGLGQAGVTVIGLGDQHQDALPSIAKQALDHYVQVGSLADDGQVAAIVRELARKRATEVVLAGRDAERLHEIGDQLRSVDCEMELEVDLSDGTTTERWSRCGVVVDGDDQSGLFDRRRQLRPTLPNHQQVHRSFPGAAVHYQFETVLEHRLQH